MRNFHFFYLLCALSFLPFSIQAQVNDPETSNRLVQSYLTQGDSLLELDGNGDRARLWYQKATAENPESALSFHKIGRSFLGDFFQGNGSQAYLDSTVVYENQARRIDTEYVDAYWNEVLAYRQRWQHGMTRKVLLEALEHLSKDPEILMLMGRNYFDTGNPGLALPYLEQSIELGGENAPGVAYRFAGWCWFYLEDHEQQLEYFNRFREIDPKSLMGIAGQVHSYTGLEDYEKATSLAIQIKDENPEYDYPAYLEAYIGETLLFGGNDVEAIEYYEKAYALDSTSQNLFATRAVTTTLGYLYLQEGNEVDGQALLEKTIARRTQEWQEMPERWEFSFDIASAYAAMGEMDLAFQWLYTSVLTGYPGHLWKKDPLFSLCHESVAFQQLVQQARIRVEGEYGK
jgi:tetratricopeptide (TPR) repeat protein